MDNSCQIYFTTKIKLDTIISDIKKLLSTLNIKNAEIYYDHNSDYDRFKEKEFPDGFLYFKYIMDIEIDLDKPTMISIVDKILKLLWNNNIPAVTACDYENELLKNGGYKNTTIPFPC